MNDVLAIIPARAGSKGIPNKNIRPFRGRPLLVHSIEQALAARTVDRVLVSTDSPEYAEIARRHGADVPFLRPAEIAGDLSTDLEVFEHALGWLAAHEGYRPEICVHLRPTYPTRRAEDIDRAVRMLREHPDDDSVRSVAPAPETPFKMWFLSDDGTLRPVVTDPAYPEAYNRPRQELPRTFLQNAAVDVVRARVVREQHSMTGRRILGMLMDSIHDIDDLDQFQAAEAALEAGITGKTFVFDIDGVLATLVPGNDYNLSGPIQEHIRIVNRLFDQANTIILCTARGSKTGIDWAQVTLAQLQSWGVKHHALQFGKPAADYYIDDRMLSLSDLNRLFPDRPTE
jgi:CMP-N,N'-diacetyllegionaminic acid synthase